MEDKTTIRIWHTVFAVSAVTLVVVSMVYWLYTEKGTGVSAKVQGPDASIEALEKKIAALEEENRDLRNTAPQIKVVTKTVEVPSAKECPEVVSAQCPPCPETKPCVQSHQMPTLAAEPVKAPAHAEGVRRTVLAAVDSVVCSTMEIGGWKMPETCRRLLGSFVKQGIDGEDFFVLTPIVDTRRYKGKQPELKQAGLGQFRVESAKKSIRSLIDPNIPVFSKKVIQKEQMRGFVLERYRVVESH